MRMNEKKPDVVPNRPTHPNKDPGPTVPRKVPVPPKAPDRTPVEVPPEQPEEVPIKEPHDPSKVKPRV